MKSQHRDDYGSRGAGCSGSTTGSAGPSGLGRCIRLRGATSGADGPTWDPFSSACATRALPGTARGALRHRGLFRCRLHFLRKVFLLEDHIRTAHALIPAAKAKTSAMLMGTPNPRMERTIVELAFTETMVTVSDPSKSVPSASSPETVMVIVPLAIVLSVPNT